jgi:molecular chaperone DnaK (HSP70)
LVLMKMKDIAEQGIGVPVHDAVITVPAYFTERQKKATEEAALLAGIYPRQLIPEPTAAAICYGFDRADPGRHVYLVYDLGGGTFDVSIIVVEQESIEVLATSGDARLGGGNFDDEITAWAMKQLAPGRTDPGWEQRLKAAAEAAKWKVAVYHEADLEVPPRDDETTAGSLRLDRDTFESLIAGLLRGSLAKVEDALSMARKKGIERDDLDAILLVGGSTRIPLVKRMLLDHFGRADDFVRSDANPDTLVARGAAIVANRFAPSGGFDLARRPDAGQVNEDQDDELDITYITEHTLVVGIQDGLVDALIPRGENIPRRAANTYINPENGTDLECPIYQGESRFAYENELVGTIAMHDIDPRPAGFHHFEVTFTLDLNGLLDVQVMHVEAGQEYRATFEQSTRIGAARRLVELRAELLALYRPPSDAADPLPGPLPGPLLDD